MDNELRVTKVIKIFTDKVREQPTFIVTYQTYQSDDNVGSRSEIIREKVYITNAYSRHRYYGYTPVLFIRREHEHDIKVLKLAHIIKKSLENAQSIVHERDIKNAIKKVLRGNIDKGNVKKTVHYDVYGEIMFKRPHVDFMTFTQGMYRKVEISIEPKVMSGEVGK